MQEKILRRELDVEIAGIDQKPVLVFDVRCYSIYLHVEINGKEYGWRHLRTRRPLKKAMERFAVLFQNLTMVYIPNEEKITEEISLCVEAYDTAKQCRISGQHAVSALPRCFSPRQA